MGMFFVLVIGKKKGWVQGRGRSHIVTYPFASQSASSDTPRCQLPDLLPISLLKPVMAVVMFLLCRARSNIVTERECMT